MACSRTSGGRGRSADPDRELFSGYVVDGAALYPARLILDEVGRKAAAISNRSWAGVNPSKFSDRDLGVFIIASERMEHDACSAAARSPRCGIARVSLDTCAAIDPSTIACDASWLLRIWSFAVFHGLEWKMRGTPGERKGRQRRRDDFFARTYGPALNNQIEIADSLLAELRQESAQVAMLTAETYQAFLELLLWHEVGHITLGHLRKGVVGVRFSGGRPDPLAAHGPETDADAFALERMVDRPRLLAISVVLLMDMDEHAKNMAALASGFPQGRMDGVKPDERQKQAWLKHYTDSTCSGTHPSHFARVLRITRSPRFRAAAANWPKGYFEKSAGVAEILTWTCASSSGANPSPTIVEAIPADATSVNIGWEPIDIRLVDAGKGPRSMLRYAWRKGSSQLVRRRTVGAATVTNDRLQSGVPMKIDDTTVLGLAVVNDDVRRPRLLIAVIESQLPVLKRDVKLVWTIDDRGMSSSVKLFSDATDVHEANLLVSMPQTQLQIVPLPEEAVAAGAVWEVRQSVTLEGLVEVTAVTSYRLISHNGTHLVIEGTATATPKSDPLPRGGQLIKAEQAISTRIDVDLTMPVHGLTQTERGNVTARIDGRNVQMESSFTTTQEAVIGPEW